MTAALAAGTAISAPVTASATSATRRFERVILVGCKLDIGAEKIVAVACRFLAALWTGRGRLGTVPAG
jgi:hypothetical protein